MSIEITQEPTYAGIIKYLVEGGIDTITDLSMDQIKIICQEGYFREVRMLDHRIDFGTYDNEGKIIKEDKEIKQEIMKRYKLRNEKQAIWKLRRLELDKIQLKILKLYQYLKISYKRKGRLETMKKALENYKREEMKKEKAGTGEETPN